MPELCRWVAQDPADLRDHVYRPSLNPLPHVSTGGIRAARRSQPDSLPYVVRHQRTDETCAGQALANLIDINRIRSAGDGPRPPPASAQMLYAMARLHDGGGGTAGRPPGVQSLRAVVKAFYHYGACDSDAWPDDLRATGFRDGGQIENARATTLGAYYRVQPFLNDYHAALHEAEGILVSAETHAGWLSPRDGVIEPHAVTDGAHAFVIVGYDAQGFLVLNSSGGGWGGYEGLPAVALWRYEDWAERVMDAWVLRLGVPAPQAFQYSVGARGIRWDSSGPPPKVSTAAHQLMGHYAHLDDGAHVRHGQYPSSREGVALDVARVAGPPRRQVMLALSGSHLGLDQAFAFEVWRRQAAKREARLHSYAVMWCNDAFESTTQVLRHLFEGAVQRVGRDSPHLDATIEEMTHGIGRAFWRDVRAAARRAGRHGADDAADGDAAHLIDSFAAAGTALHLVADGAGALLLAEYLCSLAGVDCTCESAADAAHIGARRRAFEEAVASLTLVAPAIRVDEFARAYGPLVDLLRRKGRGRATLWVPAAEFERRLRVDSYSRSILDLVLYGFERAPREARLAGMAVERSGIAPLTRSGGPLAGLRLRRIRPPDSHAPPSEQRRHYRQDDVAMNAAMHRRILQRLARIARNEEIPKMESITLEELSRKMADPQTDPDELRPYFRADPDAADPFDAAVEINPETVFIPDTEDVATRSALILNGANWLERMERQAQFHRLLSRGNYKGPVIVEEGDSWFQYPILLRDTIDVLMGDFAVYSLSAGGDTLENMARLAEYRRALTQTSGSILLISGGGNDLVARGNLAAHLQRHDSALSPAQHLLPSFDQLIAHAMGLLDRIFRDVADKFPKVTVICHGYDYAIPNRGRWLGKPMESRGIRDKALQAEIARVMVDRLNSALARLAARHQHVRYLDLRGKVGAAQWKDELHPTDAGFRAVAAEFAKAIRAVSASHRGGKDKPGDRRGTTRRDRPNAVSVHVALNKVDRRHYGDNLTDLSWCVADAGVMHDLAEVRGFRSRKVLADDEATRASVIGAVSGAAEALQEGDIFLLSYAGHGGQMKDFNRDEADGPDGDLLDETLCLWDAQLIDDELYELWSRFRPGVRVLAVFDCCHSGSMLRAAPRVFDDPARPMGKVRMMPLSASARVFDANRDFYLSLPSSAPPDGSGVLVRELNYPVQASVLQLSACESNQLAEETWGNGLFTATMSETLAAGEHRGYSAFMDRIRARMPARQSPRFWKVGAENPGFESEVVFSV